MTIVEPLTAGILTLAVAFAAVAAGAATVGQPAPDFTLTDSQGRRQTLSRYKGKPVVIEWVNFDCPFVGKHYGSGNMQTLQKTYTAQGAVWLSVNSSAPGKQGHFAPDKVNALLKEKGAAPSAYLIDADGTVGKAYGAKTTPHMFVVDSKGTLVYAGGIDDKASTDPADVPTARNFVASALDETLAGKPITTPTAPPYGCSVKY